MSLKRWAGLSVMLLMLAGLVFAESQRNVPTREGQTRPLPRRNMDAVRARSNMGREQMYRERMVRQAELHRAEIEQLLAIKKIAEEENAVKTAEAIQALIDKKNAEYQRSVEQVERARRERAERLQQQQRPAEGQNDRTATEPQQKTEESSGEAEND